MAPKITAKMMRLDVRIAQFLVRPARVGNSARHCRSNLLGVLPQSTRRMVSRARPPFGLALREFRLGQFYVKSPCERVDLDGIPVPEKCDGAPDGSLRPHMADAEPASRARKTAISDQGDLAAHPLPRQGCRR